MTLLLRRRPRVLYRVYSEEEYLNGAGSGLADIGDEWSLGESAIVDEWPLPVEPVGREVVGEGQLRRRVMGERRLHRMAGMAMLASAVVTVGGVVFLNVAWGHGRGVPRRGSFVAATRSRVVRSPALDDAQPQVTSSRPVVVSAVETTTQHSRVVHGRRNLRRQVPRRSNRLPAHHPLVRRRADVAVVANHAPGPSSGEVAPAPAQVSTTSTPVASAPARPTPENRAEFGFER